MRKSFLLFLVAFGHLNQSRLAGAGGGGGGGLNNSSSGAFSQFTFAKFKKLQISSRILNGPFKVFVWKIVNVQ